MPKIQLHGHPVIYEDEEDEGFKYLSRKIQYDEAQVLFGYAKEHGAAQFETHTNKNYSLVHHGDGTYEIVKR